VTLYLLCNALLFVAYPLALVWRLRMSTRLWLARASLLCCIAGPLAFHLIHPARPVSEAVLRSVAVDTAWETVARAPANVASRLSVSAARSADPRQIALAFVSIGFAAGLLRLGRDAGRSRRILRRAVPFRRHGGVHVLVSGDVDVPFSFRSARRKLVILPVSMLERPFDVRLAVSHEAQHHRQGDCLLAYAQELLRVVFFLNPIIHLWLRRLGELQELSCDEALVGRRRYSAHDYGSCLVRVARAAVNPGMACAVGMATRPFLERRIVMLFDYKGGASRNRWWSWVAFFVSLSPTLGVAYAASGEPRPAGFDRSHLDGRLQRIAEEETRAAVAGGGGSSAAVAVVDPRTGDVLAFAEAGGTGWGTRAIAPGSVIKPLLFDAALSAGLVTPDTVLDAHGPLSLDGQSFSDWKPMGAISVRDALTRSSNVGAIRVGQQLGLSKVRETLAAYGIAEGSRAPGESDAVRLAKLAIGDAVSTTIVAVARAYGKLATAGSDAIRSMLGEVVTKGTGSRASVPGVAVAGKTGTAREDAQGRATVLASFAGFVPSSDPRYVIYAVVESPQSSSATGGATAAPLFQRVALRGLGDR
jgi:transpeptidase family protein/BlaR1 peptidase M56